LKTLPSSRAQAAITSIAIITMITNGVEPTCRHKAKCPSRDQYWHMTAATRQKNWSNNCAEISKSLVWLTWALAQGYFGLGKHDEPWFMRPVYFCSMRRDLSRRAGNNWCQVWWINTFQGVDLAFAKAPVQNPWNSWSSYYLGNGTFTLVSIIRSPV
jgi:hypothetical protein